MNGQAFVSAYYDLFILLTALQPIPFAHPHNMNVQYTYTDGQAVLLAIVGEFDDELGSSPLLAVVQRPEATHHLNTVLRGQLSPFRSSRRHGCWPRKLPPIAPRSTTGTQSMTTTTTPGGGTLEQYNSTLYHPQEHSIDIRPLDDVS